MKKLFLGFLIFSVIGLATWAYRENYATKQSLDEVVALNQDIRVAKSRLRILQAEWAYLNRPKRLSALVDRNYESLGLHHLTKDHFVDLNQVLIPIDPDLPITTPIDVMDRGGTE